MNTNSINWIIAAVGRDASRTRAAQLTCLHLCTRLQTDGSFAPLSYPAQANGDYLGITDGGGIPRSPTAFAAAAVNAAKSRQFRGIMADLERPILQQTVSALDDAAHAAGLQLLVPLVLAQAAPHAIIVADTAVSGGSLVHRFDELAARYGRERLAAQLVCSCADFPLPCSVPNGTELSEAEFDALRHETRASAFFSKDLCAKYFTYTQNDQAHFVLFDDGDTLQYKADQLSRHGIQTMLAVFPDAQRMGLLS